MVKGKRWKKGQSSVSNPELKKHREAAHSKRNFFSFGLSDSNEKSTLTSKALAELDSKSGKNENFIDNDARSMISDAESADTFRSWASNWSDCTNATFNKVHRYWRSNSALHKEILAVLAAITEVIKENDGKETETEYFAALLTGLDSITDNEESCAAFLYLIALAIKKVPENVLRAKFKSILKSLMDPLVKHGEQANNVTLIKSGLMCLCWLLKSQDSVTWKEEATQNAYMLILSFVDHSKPKIRKCGQEAVRLILNSCCSNQSLDFDHITSFTAEFCLQLILNGNKLKEESKGDSAHNTILHTLTLIKYIIHHFQAHSLKSIGECLFRLITLKDLIMYELFNVEVSNLSAELNAQIINALYDYQPSENDPQQLIAWLGVMGEAVKSLNRLDRQLCLTHLPTFFAKFMGALSGSHHKSVHLMASNGACSVLEQCVQTNVEALSEELRQNSSEPSRSLLGKVFSHVEAGLSYQYHLAWPFVMRILATVFTCFKHRDTFPVVHKCLASMANLRESEQFTYKKEADFAIARAIKTYGPRLILECIPLHITGDETNYEYPRSWMLPLLKDNIEKTELGFFGSYVLPLARKLKSKAELFTRNKQMIEAKIFDNLQNQLWSLLPGFCDYPTDFGASFKDMAKTLGETLEKCHELRPYILQGLRTLILHNSEENKEIMSKLAKNYLPIMFNIYTLEASLEKDPVRQSLHDTVKCYLQVTSGELANTYLLQAIRNFENYSKMCEETSKKLYEAPVEVSAECDEGKKVKFDFNSSKPVKTLNEKALATHNSQSFAKYAFLDLVILLVKHADQNNIKVAYELAINAISSKNLDKTMQKKCYKMLDAILVSGKSEGTKRNEAIKAFVDARFEAIAGAFVVSLAECNAAAKVPRLRSLSHLLDYVQAQQQKVFLRQILPEVILSIKEVNHKSRSAAFELVSAMLKLWQKLGLSVEPPVTEADSLYEFFHLLMVGLAGSTNMVSCTCLALSALTFEFKDHISGPLIGELIETSCLLAKSEHKEVIFSSLNLLKILCASFSQATLAQYLQSVCGAVYNLHEKRDSNEASPVAKSQRVRALVKLILKKLMKKFSYEIVHEKVLSSVGKQLSGAVRQSLENLMHNLKKTIEKEKQKKLDDAKAAKKGNKVGKDADLISMYTTKTSKTLASNYNEIEDLLKESESEDEDGKNELKSNKSNKSKKVDKKKKNEGKSVKNQMAWIQEDDNEDPLDLLDPMAIKHVLATKPLTKEQIVAKKEKERNAKNKNRGFKMGSDGRLMIDDDDGDNDEDEKNDGEKKKTKKKRDEIEEMMDTLSLSKKSLAASKKSKRVMEEDSDDEADEAKSKFSYRTGGTGIHRKVGKKEKVDYGAEYRAKKARGDVKKKNKPDPYAYIPFDYNKLNKRKRAKLQGEYKGIVKAVNRGAQKSKTKRLK